MILQKSGNMDVVIKTNTDARADCHSVGRGPAAEEVGMVARSQPPTKLIVEQIRIFRGIAGVIVRLGRDGWSDCCPEFISHKRTLNLKRRGWSNKGRYQKKGGEKTRGGEV